MAVPNIELRRERGQWRWHVIAPCGRSLVQSAGLFLCELAAMTAAKQWRAGWIKVAESVDGRLR